MTDKENKQKLLSNCNNFKNNWITRINISLICDM